MANHHSLASGRFRRLVCSLAILHSLGAGLAAAQSPPFLVGGDPRVDPNDFRVTLYASGLDSPLSMQMLSDGSLLVGTEGGLLRLVDADDDGVADGPGSLVYAAVPDFVTSVRLAGDLVFVASAQTILILRQGAQPSDAMSFVDSIDIEIPFPWSHISFTLAVRQTQPDVFDLFFSLGSKDDAAATAGTVPVSGAVSGAINPDAIHRVVVDDSGPSLTVTGPEQITSGVRSVFGMAFHPVSGDFYFQDNSIDGETPPYEVSVDELNRVALADIGGAVEDFGFPDNYIEYRTGIEVGSGGIDPLVTFQPIPPPNGAESEGAAEIRFAPPLFPPGLNDGVFVGFHGAFTTAGTANTDNPVVYVDLGTLETFHFVSNTEAGIGHPDGLYASEDSLFIADFTSINGFIVPGAGKIYQLKSLVEPPRTPALSPVALGLLLALLLALGSLRAKKSIYSS